MSKQVIDSPRVFPLRNFTQLDPPHGVPINMAVKAKGTLLFTKQVPLDAQGNSVGINDIKEQTRQTLENLKAMVSAAGATMADLVAITWYTTAIDDYYSQAGSRLRREYLAEPHPTSVVVEVSRLAKREWMVELLAVVVVPD
jgi:2-iminobutanoate/2-iminopropanoate deaminase